MKIGALAQLTQTQTETIRYYEREGLLPAAPRGSSSNYREYGAAHVERLALIRRCRSLDMSLDEVRELLRIWDQPEADCGAVNALLDAHIAHVTQRIAELKSLHKELLALRQRCTASSAAADCGILDGLSAAAPGSVTPPAHLRSTHGAAPRRRRD